MSRDHARSHAGLSLTALAGLAAAGLCWAAASAQSTTDWSKARVVEIDLKNFAFSPSRLVLQQGQVYRLHFVNQSSGGHDFTAPTFFAAAMVDPASQGVVEDGSVRLAGGRSADVDLIAPRAGRYPDRCSHLMHAALGMAGEVVVE